jgi:hypothetical protein
VRPYLHATHIVERVTRPEFVSFVTRDPTTKHVHELLLASLQEDAPGTILALSLNVEGNKFAVNEKYAAVVYDDADAVPMIAVTNLLRAAGVRVWLWGGRTAMVTISRAAKAAALFATEPCAAILISCSKVFVPSFDRDTDRPRLRIPRSMMSST